MSGEQTLENLETLVTISRLLSSKLELADLLGYITQLASRVVGAERASLFLVDDETREIYFDVAMGLDAAAQTIRLKIGEGVAGLCALEGKSSIINDAASDSRHSRKVDSRSGFVTRSILTCPMIIKGHVIGVVQALNRIDGPFTARDMRNFEAFASQAAVAIENARLFSSLKEEKRRLQIFFTQTKEGAILTSPAGDVLLANDAAKAYLGAGDGLNSSVRDLFSGMKISPEIDGILSGLAAITEFEAERSRPKKLYLAGCAIRLKKEAGEKDGEKCEGWLWLMRDVTSQKLEEKMSRSFLSLVSHKLRTPLTVINGYAGMLSDSEGGAAPADFALKAVTAIGTQSKKLASLVEQLLSFVETDELDESRLEKTELDLKALSEEAASQFSAEGRSVEIAVQPQKLAGDKRLLLKTFGYLIDNAFKFNDKPQKKLKITSAPENGSLSVIFEDNGRGIPPEELAKIFEKFYQVETAFTGQVEGWGLGLAFVKKVMEAHGGTAGAKSKLGEGAEFTLRFPTGK